MMNSLLWKFKDVAKAWGLDTRAVYQAFSKQSLLAAIREQGLEPMVSKCREIIPDISDQYTAELDATEYSRYWELKMRGLHAFQVQCMLRAVETLKKDNLVIVDVGDSCGNHFKYLKALTEPGRIGRSLSVNLDPEAVKKIKSKGGEAVLSRAEELKIGSIVDLMMSFEMLEHLTDPTRFLHDVAQSGVTEHLLVTVPFRNKSRVGLNDLRLNRLPPAMTAEGVHIFELCPEDWTLIARFAGWKPLWTQTYLQYPRLSPWRAMAPVWEKLDHPGFWGVFLTRDLSVARTFRDW